MTTRRAVVASYCVPRPARDSGGRRLDDLIQFLLGREWEVEFVAMYGTDKHPDDVARLRRRGVFVHGDNPAWQNDGTVEANETFARLLDHARFDLALLAFWPVAEYYLPRLRERAPDTRIIVDSVDLHFMRECRRAASEWGPDVDGPPLPEHLGADFTSELNVYAAADAVLTVSAKERDVIHDLLGGQATARVVPDCETVVPAALTLEARSGLLFLGSFEHPPNVEALEFFCRDVLPLVDPAVLARHPVYVVGNALDDRLRGLAAGNPAVRMVGWVPEVTPYFHRVRASVVPLLHGAGTKRKMVQALMHGTPTVSTSIGTEGLSLVDGEHVLVADDAAGIARGIERLLTDDALAARLACVGHAHVKSLHGREMAAQALDEVVQEVLARPAKPAMLPVYPPLRNLSRYMRPKREKPSVDAISAPQASDSADAVRLIALFLPQFHPIPENDVWSVSYTHLTLPTIYSV